MSTRENLEAFVTMFLLLLSLSATLTAASGQILIPEPQCTIQNTVQALYHAPGRVVPNPPVDAELKRQFLLLFHREGNLGHTHFDPHDNVTAESLQPSLIDPAIIARINELCGRDSLFYSFSPRHQEAINLLQQRVFTPLPTAADIFNIAKYLLNRHEINPRVWYYSLLQTIFSRPDLNGYYLAWAVDATPDLYVPWTIIRDAIQESARPQTLPQETVCQNALGVVTIDSKFPSPPGPTAAVQPLVLVNPVQQLVSLRKKRETPGKSEPKQNDSAKSKLKRKKRQTGRCILFNGTNGTTSPVENQLWYFREDVMVNHHHWYWHQYFPQTSASHSNRRGETFYYAHHNLIARYNAERIAHGLAREEPLDLRLNGNVGVGYNSDLNDRQSGRFWTPRAHNIPLSDITHANDPDFQVDVRMSDATNLHNLLMSHIAQGYLVANRSLQVGRPPVEHLLDIKTQPGLNDLGNTIEAGDEIINVHSNVYHPFGVHNLGHVAIALSMDPDFSCQLPTGVMADLSITMRDVAFYKIHTLADVLFDQHKITLPPYQISGGEWPLTWPGVHVQSVEMVQANSINLVNTFWQIRSFPLEEGIDGSIHDGDITAQVCQQHLNHEPFTFKLVVDVDSCWQSRTGQGTVRLFMAPKFDQTGRRHTLNEERTLMFQLDTFTVPLTPGRNIITRNSVDSASTKPWSRSLSDMLRDPNNGGQTEYCGCGWPQHLFMPKGTPEGMEFDLFAIITDYDVDEVLQTAQNLAIPEPCNSAWLFCGIPYKQYPDARPMGYPFDRLAYSINDGGIVRPVASLEEYVANVPNTRSAVVIVTHLNTVVG